MTIQYCSDLHLEFPANKKYMERHLLEPMGEVLILAGDILPFALHSTQSPVIDFIADNFEQVYWVPGNHEYYDYDLATVADPLLEKLRSNVWLVNNQVIDNKGISFICSTLWSKVEVVNALDIQRGISDFFTIQWNGEKFTTEQFNQLHNRSVDFLEKAFKEKTAEKSIVVTHHVPTLYDYPKRFRSSKLNGAFVTELHDLVHDSGADYWIYGHHHFNVPSFKIGATTMLTNQLGYVHHGEHYKFNKSAVIEI
ncbi:MULTISPECIES: metallophosphoesterase [Niastella]|uniref:Metallophosphoesterase n=1 Tax=Niastella soli TaxID=2821487 RepID=A0ABS3YRU5_9BACT|nr:metallophosphoesterase [Niastella soli]MBO9200600.1 metallophosphoesterase [Niastella soli]